MNYRPRSKIYKPLERQQYELIKHMAHWRWHCRGERAGGEIVASPGLVLWLQYKGVLQARIKATQVKGGRGNSSICQTNLKVLKTVIFLEKCTISYSHGLQTAHEIYWLRQIGRGMGKQTKELACSRQPQVVLDKKIPAWKPKTCLKNQPWEHTDFVRNDLSTSTTGAPTEMKGTTNTAEAQSTK